MVVAQLAERRSLPIPEVRGSNPVISEILFGTYIDFQMFSKDDNKRKKKKPGMAHFWYYQRHDEPVTEQFLVCKWEKTMDAHKYRNVSVFLFIGGYEKLKHLIIAGGSPGHVVILKRLSVRIPALHT